MLLQRRRVALLLGRRHSVIAVRDVFRYVIMIPTWELLSGDRGVSAMTKSTCGVEVVVSTAAARF